MEFFDDFEEESIDSKISRYETALNADPSFYFDRDDYQDVVEFYLVNLEFDKAKQALDFALEQHPGSVDLQINQAQLLQVNGKNKEALSLINHVTEIDPINIDAWITRGAILSRLNNTKDALKSYKKALQLDTQNEDVLMMLGVEYQKSLNFTSSLRYFKRALHLNPENDLALNEISNCFEAEDKYKEAIKFFESFIDKHPYNASAWLQLAYAFEKEGKTEDAIWAYDYVTIINPFFSHAFLSKASLQINLKQYKNAIETIEDSFEFEDPYYITYCQIGECFERLKQFDEAIVYYTKAIDDNKEYPDGWLGKAIALDAKGEYKKALEHINMAIKLDKNDADYYYVKAEILENLEAYDDAEQAFMDAMSLEPDDEEITLDYFQFLKRHQDLSDVLATTREWIEEGIHAEYLKVFEVYLLLELKQFAKAYKLLENVLSQDPTKSALLANFTDKVLTDQNILQLIDLYSN
jgi:tetratricopeptide (TPR) repeat protein